MFDYEHMATVAAQQAARDIVRNVLTKTSQMGLDGVHHFYLTFQTNRSDVIMPSHLREKHPEEITIVLQHQFWDLKVDHHKFEVTLSFNDNLETLIVPFAAMISFFDPSVKYVLPLTPSDPPAVDKKSRIKSKDKMAEAPVELVMAKVVALDTFRRSKR